jgi:hypothetical protein
VALPDPPDPDDALAARRRTVLFTAVGAVLAAALLVAVVARATSTTSSSGAGGSGGRTQAAEFDVGNAGQRAATVDRSGPILFPDPQGHSRDIYVQHLGGSDWVAFEARPPGAPRQCVLRWEQAARHFVDPCDGRIYPPDGAGLVTFPAHVNDKGRLIVELGSPIDGVEPPAP